ncbi:Alpha/Beta hydrolase protein [Ilyonectria destructans]|nr:Alpha/Beta hydrolase protein [Ilyonectria destructans]
MGNSISYTTSECKAVLQGNSGAIKGVPYAKPPVGSLRWRRPQPLSDSHSYSSPDGTPYDATAFGPVCPQANYSKTTPVPDPKVPHPKWPVVIWFHGGWFQVGDPSQEESMDPTELISTGNLQAVFIAVGYRLNVFGFLAGRALRDESNGMAVGN